MRVAYDKRFVRSIAQLSGEQVAALQRAGATAAVTFGQPHLHSGRGIQELRPGLYECRAGLGLRLLFARHGDELLFIFAGNHDQVKAYLRNRR